MGFQPAAFRGEGDTSSDAGLSTERVDELAYLLSQLWFTGLVGWMGGLHDTGKVAIPELIKPANPSCRD